MLQALKRQAASGDINKLHWIPGFAEPVRQIVPINSDRRYRQYRVIKKPSSNAVIFFARDGSGSMDQYKCDIVSDMCWWLDLWIRQFYKRVERCYIWHDTLASEVDEKKFYRYRYGGGTTCSSALKLISKQFDNRFPPNKWNIYVFYFTDGENWGEDNEVFVKTLKEKFNPEVANFVGITQVMATSYGGPENTLKGFVDGKVAKSKKLTNIKTTEIGFGDNSNQGWGAQLTEEERDRQIKDALIDLLGTSEKKVVLKEKVANNG